MTLINNNKKELPKEILPKDVLINLDVEYADERGSIIPLADIPMKSCVLITSKKNTVRANHYHKTDWHFCYVIKGSIDYYHRPHGKDIEPEKLQIKEGKLFFTPPMVDHAMVFTEDTTFLTLGRNSREQHVYEEDVERIVLIDPNTLKK
jgi:dTDP-4-dehydrorhamnose 3,5-epimerase-like enzyme